MIDFRCPQCDNRVRLDLRGIDEHPEIVAFIEAWCCTRHPRPVRMVTEDVEPKSLCAVHHSTACGCSRQ